MDRDKALQALEQLLEQCGAAVEGTAAGTGFFVAPGWLLTCAHVSGADPGAPVTVRWQGDAYEAVVRTAGGCDDDAPALWPHPDLALLELPAGPDDHPCVRLDGALPARRAELTVLGHDDTYDPDRPAPRLAYYRYGGRQPFRGARLVTLTDGEIGTGMSGGPVLDLASGAVCAVVKATRREDEPHGGVATPVDALRLLDPGTYRRVIRAHDAFHDRDDRWSRLSDAITADDRADRPRTTPAETRRILALLAELPDEPDHSAARRTAEAAFRRAAAPGTPLPGDHPLLGLRDAFAELAALVDAPPGVLPYPLALAADTAREAGTAPRPGTAAGRLRDEVLVAAGRLRMRDAVLERLAPGPGGTGGQPASLVCCVRPSYRDHRLYHARIVHYRAADDIVPAGPESGELPLPDAFAWLRRRLPDEIRAVGGATSPGLIELVLPAEAVDEAVAEWALWPGKLSVLGGKQYVVLRALERHGDPDVLAGWQERWDGLGERPVGEALWCACGRDGQHPRALEAYLDLHPRRAALVLAGSPGAPPAAETYAVAVASGVPLMVWRRGAPVCDPGPDPCAFPGAGPGRCGCPGGDLRPCAGGCGSCVQDHAAACPGEPFASAVRDALAGTGRDDVPARVRDLRNAAAAGGTGHVGNGIAVLWDDPRRQLPHVPLEMAEEGHSA